MSVSPTLTHEHPGRTAAPFVASQSPESAPSRSQSQRSSSRADVTTGHSRKSTAQTFVASPVMTTSPQIENGVKGTGGVPAALESKRQPKSTSNYARYPLSGTLANASKEVEKLQKLLENSQRRADHYEGIAKSFMDASTQASGDKENENRALRKQIVGLEQRVYDFEVERDNAHQLMHSMREATMRFLEKEAEYMDIRRELERTLYDPRSLNAGLRHEAVQGPAHMPVHTVPSNYTSSGVSNHPHETPARRHSATIFAPALSAPAPPPEIRLSPHQSTNNLPLRRSRTHDESDFEDRNRYDVENTKRHRPSSYSPPPGHRHQHPPEGTQSQYAPHNNGRPTSTNHSGPSRGPPDYKQSMSYNPGHTGHYRRDEYTSSGRPDPPPLPPPRIPSRHGSQSTRSPPPPHSSSTPTSTNSLFRVVDHSHQSQRPSLGSSPTFVHTFALDVPPGGRLMSPPVTMKNSGKLILRSTGDGNAEVMGTVSEGLHR